MIPCRYNSQGVVSRFWGVEPQQGIPSTVPFCGSFCGRQDTTQYREFLKGIEKRAAGSAVFLLHDQHPVHKAAAIRSWFREHQSFNIVPFPGQSGDLNVIGNVWDSIVNNVNQGLPRIDTEEALKIVVVEAWDELMSNEDYVASLIDSMRNR